MLSWGDKAYRINGHFVAKKAAYGSVSDVLLFNLESGEMLYVDEVSYGILKLIQDGITPEALLPALGISHQEAGLFLDALAHEEIITCKRGSGKVEERNPRSDYRSLDHVNMVLTETCNYNCHFCYRGSNPRALGTLDERDALKAIDAFDRLGVIDVSLSGGEPLLVPYIYNYIDELRSRRYHVNLQTNMSLINERSPLLNGCTPHKITTSCDSIAGGGHSLKNIETPLRLVLSSGIEVAVNITILPSLVSKNEVSRLVDRLLAMGVDDLSIGSAIPSNEFTSDDFDQSFGFIDLVTAIKKKEGIKCAGVEKINNDKNAPLVNPRLVCGAGDYNCSIDWKKRIQPCPALTGYYVDINDITEFPSVWSSNDTFWEFRNPDKLLEECMSCDHLSHCQGGCKAKSLAIFERLQAPDPWSCAIFGK